VPRPRLQARPDPLILLLADSQQDSIQHHRLAEVFGPVHCLGMGQGGRANRIFTSDKDWLGAKYKDSNLSDVVPRLLAERKYTYLIAFSPTSDLTNLRGLGVFHQRRLCRQSAVNIITVLEAALASSPSLQHILLMERLPRVDDLAGLNKFFNELIHSEASRSSHHSKINVGCGWSAFARTPLCAPSHIECDLRCEGGRPAQGDLHRGQGQAGHH
jgi:hypothetical protein